MRKSREELDRLRSERAGCRALRYAHGRILVGLYNSAEADLDGEPWATVCEEHGAIVTHELRRRAELHLSYPEEWCESCAVPRFDR